MLDGEPRPGARRRAAERRRGAVHRRRGRVDRGRHRAGGGRASTAEAAQADAASDWSTVSHVGRVRRGDERVNADSRVVGGPARDDRRRDAADRRGARSARAARRRSRGGRDARPPRPGAFTPGAGADGSRQRDRRVQAAVAVARRAARRLRSGGDRDRLCRGRRGGDFGADRADVLRRLARRISRPCAPPSRRRCCARTSSSPSISCSRRARPAPTRCC